MIKIYKISSFLFGLFSILEAFKYQVGGVSLYFGDILYYIYSAITCIFVIYFHKKDVSIVCERHNRIHVPRRYYTLWVMFTVLLIGSLNIWSPIIDTNIATFEPNGVEVAIKYAVKTIISLFIFYLILNLPQFLQKQTLRYFSYGFISAVYLHAFYSLVQLVFWYIFADDIHTKFLGYFGITENSVGHVLVNFLIVPVIRPSGIHWDPAYFGLWGEIILLWWFYAKVENKRYKLFAKIANIILLITWLLSFSRTGYFALLASVGILTLLSYRNRSIRRPSTRILLKGLIGFICLFGLLICSLPKDVSKSISKGIEYRFTASHNDEGTNRHIMYPIYVMKGMLHDPYHFLLGYGARNSSRAIYHSGELSNFVNTEETFDIESDFCKMAANFGFIYFLVYLYFNYKIVICFAIKQRLQSDSIATFFLICIISIFFAGLFYVYNDSKWVWFIYFYALLYLSDSNKHNEYGKRS